MTKVKNFLQSKTIGNYITILGIIVSMITSLVAVTYWIVSKLCDIDKRTTVTQIQVVHTQEQLSDLKSNCVVMSQDISRLETKFDRREGKKHEMEND